MKPPFGLWHASCIFLLPGCLYVTPVRRPEVNNPPEVLATTPTVEDGLVLNPIFDGNVQVVATDADGDPLLFVWGSLGVGAESPAIPNEDEDGQVIWLAAYRIPSSEITGALDGEELVCVILDKDESVRLSWPVSVEE